MPKKPKYPAKNPTIEHKNPKKRSGNPTKNGGIFGNRRKKPGPIRNVRSS